MSRVCTTQQTTAHKMLFNQFEIAAHHVLYKRAHIVLEHIMAVLLMCTGHLEFVISFEYRAFDGLLCEPTLISSHTLRALHK